MTASDNLITKYRPQALEEIIGQEALVASLRGVIEKRSASAFLFIGPSGCGKTTLARIVAAMLGCTEVKEEDAATNTGIDAMRLITSALQYKPIGGGAKGILIDEAHMLSKGAWNSLLKNLEEPPDWAFWFICTTDADKVPKTVLTRCVRYEVKPVKWDVLANDLLIPIANAEQMQAPDPVVHVCARMAEGSPRQALANLAQCADILDPTEASRLLSKTVDDEKAGIDLARALMKGLNWTGAMQMVAALQEAEENPEGVRRVICAYAMKAATGAKDAAAAQKPLALLHAFSQPFATADGYAPLVLALGGLLARRGV
jgi:DNA polymerase-3 subunit gamma/tau